MDAVDPSAIKQITSGHLMLKPDDAKKLKKVEPGIMVRIVIKAEIRAVGKDRPHGDSAEYVGDLDFDVLELTIEKADNDYQAMSREDD